MNVKDAEEESVMFEGMLGGRRPIVTEVLKQVIQRRER